MQVNRSNALACKEGASGNCAIEGLYPRGQPTVKALLPHAKGGEANLSPSVKQCPHLAVWLATSSIFTLMTSLKRSMGSVGGGPSKYSRQFISITLL